MKKEYKNERGAALVVALAAVALLSLLGGLLLHCSSIEVRMARSQEELTKAHYLAEGALELALAGLQATSDGREAWTWPAEWQTAKRGIGTPDKLLFTDDQGSFDFRYETTTTDNMQVITIRGYGRSGRAAQSLQVAVYLEHGEPATPPRLVWSP